MELPKPTERDRESLAALRTAIRAYGSAHPDAKRSLEPGDRIINKGGVGRSCFLIVDGSATVILVDQATGNEREIAVRYEGEFLGEPTLFSPKSERTADVAAGPQGASVIEISREDMLALMRRQPDVHSAINLIFNLNHTRDIETLRVTSGDITSESKVMSILIGDVHGFTQLSEVVWEQYVSSFLFDLLETSESTTIASGGAFEEQGDGFKILFTGKLHAQHAATVALDIANEFRSLRSAWITEDDAFEDIGLGIGICTGPATIRRREGSPRPDGRVHAHIMNVAAALAKPQERANDVTIMLDQATADAVVGVEGMEIGRAAARQFEKLSEPQEVFALAKAKPTPDGVRDGGHSSENRSEIDLRPQQSAVDVLFLASDPSDLARLRLLEEAREIEETLKRSEWREYFSFYQRGAVRAIDLSQSLLELEPRVVHFSGHGSSSGRLFLEDLTGSSIPVEPRVLSQLFSEFKGVVDCVVLNACYSHEQAAAIGQHIEHVVGMSESIGDSAAIAFSVGMYQALGAGKPVPDAYRFGCIQIGLRGLGEELTPTLLRAGIEVPAQTW